MTLTHKSWRWLAVIAVLGLVVTLVSACGSGSGSSTGSTPSTVSGLKQTGPGLTEPTTGRGAKIKGGTITFAETAGAPPNYIFPMYSSEYCTPTNAWQLIDMMYRPLYWFGNNYDPTVDYNYSVGKKPVVSNGGQTFTIRLNHYMWSDGEQISARDLVFWMNILKADPAKEWCGYVPGRFPDNVTSYKAVNATTFQLTFNRAYNPTWVVYNELSQIYPMPIAWDRTSLSAKAPNPTQANLPDTTKSGADAVYDLLNTQGQKINDWGTSPLWSIVDGPWKVQSTTDNGGVTMVANKSYTGPVKPTISKFVEIPFTSESALVDQIKSQGPSNLSVAYIPPQYQPLTSSFENQGYDVNMASSYSFNFFMLNQHNPTLGPVFRQLYFRQALQHLVDQEGWIDHFLHGTGVATYSPLPTAPPSSILSGVNSSTNPYAFSVADASKLLSDHGWKVVPSGQTTCQRPGIAADECGKGVKQNQPLTFNIDYISGTVSVQEEMEDLQSQAAQVGIKITLTTHPTDDVEATAVQCTSKEPSCGWEAANWGTGWIYGPDYYPTGEELLQKDAVLNTQNYYTAKMDTLIARTITGPAGSETTNMKAYVRYAEEQVPFVYEPTSIGTFVADAGTLIDNKIGGYTANAYGWLSPEQWYLTK